MGEFGELPYVIKSPSGRMYMRDSLFFYLEPFNQLL